MIELRDPSPPPAWPQLLAGACRGDGLRIAFQPIVDLERLVVTGYEALARFERHDAGPERWFTAATAHGLAAELDTATLRAALTARNDLPRNTFLTVNVEPASLFAPSVQRVFDEQGDLSGVVIEITERDPFFDAEALVQQVERLRVRNALIAVDDAGAGHSGLQRILTLRPSILKLDRGLVAGIERDEAKVALVEMFGLFANRIDSWLLAEGVETEGEASRLMDLGVPLAQGFVFAAPQRPWGAVEPEVRARLLGRRVPARPDSLLALLEPIDTTTAAELRIARRPVPDGERWVAVVDDHGRAVGLADAQRSADGIRQPVRSNVHATAAELAVRISTRTPGDTDTPVLVHNDEGRLLGMVRVARLLGHLGRTATTALA